MNILYIILIALLSFPLSGIEDKMIDTLKRIDTDDLNRLLIPGFFIGKEELKRYLDVAKEMTNRTHQQLHSYSGWDIIRFGKGLGEIALAGVSLTAAYLYYKEHWDISRWTPDVDKIRIIKGQDLTDAHQRGAVYGILGLFTWYLFTDAMEQFSAIINKKDRLDNHRRALQNEAVIQRIPVIDAICSLPQQRE